MSEENVNLAGQFYEAWNRGDVDWIGERITDEFELRPISAFLDLEAVYRGRNGWERFAQTWLQAWEAAPVELERMEDLGDRVLVLLTFNATGRKSGVTTPLKVGHLMTFRDRQLVSLLVMEDWDEALEAAGLKE